MSVLLQFWDWQALFWSRQSWIFSPQWKQLLNHLPLHQHIKPTWGCSCVRALIRALTKSIITKSSWVFPVLLPLEPSECKLPCRGDSASGESGGLTCPRKQTQWVLILWSHLHILTVWGQLGGWTISTCCRWGSKDVLAHQETPRLGTGDFLKPSKLN